MNGSGQSILLDEPREVDVVSIERELTGLWKRASDDDTHEASPVVRACSMNLIVFTEDESRADDISSMVGDVTLEHPSRIFLITADRRSASPYLDTWISARCSIPVPGGKQVCCEQINLTANGTEAKKIPSIVTSLLVPDVPTVLLWKTGVDAKDHVFSSLIEVSDRVLIDSSEDQNPEAALLVWGRMMKGPRNRAAFCDLAWTHLTRWRSVLARTFQPPEMLGALPAISSVTVDFSTTRAPSHSGLSQSFLLIGWLTHALRWSQVYTLRRTETGTYEAKLRFEQQAISVRIGPGSARATGAGGIESIEIDMASGARVIVRTDGREDAISVMRHWPDRPDEEETISLHMEHEPELVSRELEVVQRDSVYEESVAKLTSLLMET